MITFDRMRWEQMYQLQVRNPDAPDNGQWVRGLTRRFAEQFTAPDVPGITEWTNRADSLVARYNLQGVRVLVVGSAYGYLVEALKDAGVNAWGMDNAPYIHTTLDQHRRNDVSVMNADMRTVRWQDVRGATGDRYFDCVITEDVVTCYTDAELPALLNACEAFLRTGRPRSLIVHMFSPDVDLTAIGGAPARTLEQWATVRPAHSWVSVSGLRHVVGTG